MGKLSPQCVVGQSSQPPLKSAENCPSVLTSAVPNQLSFALICSHG